MDSAVEQSEFEQPPAVTEPVSQNDEAERLSEEARLTYVALTRARRRCYVAWGDVPGRDGPPARRE